MFGKQKPSLPTLFYWLLPLLLWALQLAYTFNSMNQIRYEELAESIRNVYWLDQHTIYDGISSNVGYYGTLLSIYQIFGFSVYTAKFVKLAIHLISLLCLAALLQRYLGKSKAWPILLTLGLSPTWLYFNTIQTSFGIDLQYIPICLFLIAFNDFKTRFGLGQSCFLGILAMIACMSFPTFILYLPGLFILYIARLMQKRQSIGNRFVVLHLLLGVLAFLLPFLIALLYLKDPALFLYDPNTQGGIFRGGGVLLWDWPTSAANLIQVINDLYRPGSSYHFELKNVEFSNIFIQISALLILLFGIVLLATTKNKSLGLVLLTAYLLLLINLIIPNLTDSSSPGIRRSTGLIAAFYAIYAGVWFYITSQKDHFYLKWLGILICLLPLLHHLSVYVSNYSAIVNPSRYRNVTWFAVRATPHQSLQAILDYVENDQLLICLDSRQQAQPCRYSEIFGAIAGHRKWNGVGGKPVLAYDWKAERSITLSTQLWEEYYFPH